MGFATGYISLRNPWELASLYRVSKRGQPPIAPAQLALATIVQAYTGVSDDEVIEATLMDRRWQLMLDCLDTDLAPFSKGTLVAFRQRLIEAQMDRRLIERTSLLKNPSLYPNSAPIGENSRLCSPNSLKPPASYNC